jgi:hypothetical protein
MLYGIIIGLVTAWLIHDVCNDSFGCEDEEPTEHYFM